MHTPTMYIRLGKGDLWPYQGLNPSSSGSSNFPPGGSPGQALVKRTSADDDVQWASVATMSAVNAAIDEALGGVAQAPHLVADSTTANDTASSIAINLLANDSDPAGGTLSVVSISYLTTSYLAGTTITAGFGSLNVGSNGVGVFTPNNTARALLAGQTASEVFSYTATNTAGVRSTVAFTVNITGTNGAPVAASDIGTIPYNTTGIGNVLVNDSDPEGTTLTVVNYTITGIAGTHAAGTSTTIPGVGDFSLSSIGVWSFAPVTDWSGAVPQISYVVSDGASPATGVLRLSVLLPVPDATQTQAWYAPYAAASVGPTHIATNPPPARSAPDTTTVVGTYPNWNWSCQLPSRVGVDSTSLDFRVGPGMEYTNISDVPWESLLPGDRVFIYWRATPYKEFIHLTVRGEPTRWIEVIGVPNEYGQMPVMDGDHAVANPAYNWASDREGSGLIICAPKPGLTYGFKPGYIHIHGIKFTHVRHGYNYTARSGTVFQWDLFCAAIAAHGVDHLTITGCEMANNAIGVFVNSTQNERLQSRDVHIAFNYIYGGGNVNSASEHNCYTEAVGIIYEANYIGSLVQGAWGLLVKERSAGVVFRYNFFENTTSCTWLIGLQDPDSNAAYEGTQVDSLSESLMSQAFVYGNTFLVASSMMYDGWAPAVIEHGAGGVVSTGNPQYRYGSLHVYNNKFISKLDITTVYVIPGSGMSGVPVTGSIPMFLTDNIRLPTTVHARNNLAYGVAKTSGATPMPWALFGGPGAASFQQNWMTTFQNTGVPYDTRGVPLFDGTGLGGLTASTSSPGFRGFNVGDYFLNLSSPYYSLTATAHTDVVARGLTHQTEGVLTPFGLAHAPVEVTRASMSTVTGGTVPVGVTVTGIDAAWAFGVDSATVDFLLDGTVAGSTHGYTPTTGDLGKALTFRHTVTNAAGTVSSTSVAATVVSATQPVNITLPSIVGIAMEGSVPTYDPGTWTNSPSSFTYEVRLNGTVVGDETYLLTTADVGKSLDVRVTAHNGSSTGVATSVSVAVAVLAYDPDSTGTFQFVKVDGTTLVGVSSKFQSVPSQYAITGNALRGTMTYPGATWYDDGQGADQAVGGVIKTLAHASSTVIFGMQRASGQTGYEVAVKQSSVELYAGGTFVQSVSHSLSTPIAVDITLIAGVLDIELAGSSVLSHTFSSPLTGGFPALQITTATGGTSDTELDSFYGKNA